MRRIPLGNPPLTRGIPDVDAADSGESASDSWYPRTSMRRIPGAQDDEAGRQASPSNSSFRGSEPSSTDTVAVRAAKSM